MNLSALTVEHWIFICLNFLMGAGLSYWRIRACVFANLGDKWLKWKIVIAVVLCIYTVVSTVLMLCYLPDLRLSSMSHQQNLIPGLH